MATNQTECLPYKGDYAAYVSPDIKVGYTTLILQLYITQTCTYIHTKSQGTFKNTEYDMHTASCVIRCPVVSIESMHQNGKYQTQCFNVIRQKQTLMK